MKPKIKKIIFCLLFVNLLIPFIPVYTQVRNDNIEQLIENRRKRENELKAQVEDLLAKIIGPNDSVVTVSIRITAEERAVKKSRNLSHLLKMIYSKTGFFLNSEDPETINPLSMKKKLQL